MIYHVGKIVTLCSAFLLVISGYVTTRRSTINIQTVRLGLNTLACLLLGMWPSATLSAICIPRNIYAQKGMLTVPCKALLTVVTTTFLLVASGGRFISTLLIISNVTYLWLMDRLDDKAFKLLVIVTVALCGIYDFIVYDLLSVIFEVACIVTSTLAILRIKEKEGAS